jgi:carbonic anhydrase/acetyltransferase-like protein (isoleucine patch superfamily)
VALPSDWNFSKGITVSEYGDLVVLDQPSYVHESALLFGKISTAPNVSIWPNVVMRAEQYEIVIGEYCNIQDFVMIHVGDVCGTYVGANCSITHRVTLHGCEIGDNCLIGINATIMDRAVIGANSIVAGHTIINQGTIIPPNSIVAGVPGKVIKTRNNWVANRMNAWLYHVNAEGFAKGDHRTWSGEKYLAERDAKFASLQKEFAELPQN